MIKTLEQLRNENTPYGTYGVHYFNLETGVTPEIDDSVAIIGTLDCLDLISIEPEVFSGHDVMILTGAHDPMKLGHDRKESGKNRPIYIKRGVWLGSRCMILGGVTIGRYSVVAAGSVVVRDVPDYVVVGGNPARVLKEIEHEG
jgi:acetyltransferase-like isoleucine patch superfamily enzyme